MPDGKVILYQAKVIPTLQYDLDDIFEKRLYALLPYYILKYEKNRDALEASKQGREKVLADYREIAKRLTDILESEKESAYVSVVLQLINKIVRNVLNGQPKIRKGVEKLMGGRVLELASDKIREAALREGKKEGKREGKKEERGIILENVITNLKRQHPKWTDERAKKEAKALIEVL